MVMLYEIIEKLKDIISEDEVDKKIFDKDVAKVLDISQSTFATMKKRNSIPYKEILEFCATKKISVNWLFFDQAVDMLKEQTDKFFHIRYFSDIRASAGGGAEIFNENFELITIDEKIIYSMVGNGNSDLDAIKVEGDSMEPTFQNESIVFVDRTQNNINKDGVFIASTTAGLFIKRVRQRTNGMIELISDNKLYSSELIPPNEVTIVGRVVGNIDSFN